LPDIGSIAGKPVSVKPVSGRQAVYNDPPSRQGRQADTVRKRIFVAGHTKKNIPKKYKLGDRCIR